jgi:osmotically-inducible protein OsmY
MSRSLSSALVSAAALATLVCVATPAVAQAPSTPPTTQPRQAPMPMKYTLKDRIEYRLETNDTVKKYDVKVEVADGGIVTLSGDVATAAQKTQAEALAKVDGVTRVVNNIEVDANADATIADRTKKGLNKAGEAITDAWITTKVKWFLVGEDLLKDSNINADTAGGVVTLKGTVKTDAGKKRAVALTQGVDGVKRVIDQMTIG